MDPPADPRGLAVPRPFPEALKRFAALYEAGAYFRAHEVLEEAWHQTQSDFYRGLIILAAAFCKRDRGNGRGVARNLEKARRRLGRWSGWYLGVDVPRLLAAIEESLQRLAEAGIEPDGGGTESVALSVEDLRRLVPHVPLDLRPERIRGDESEARGPA